MADNIDVTPGTGVTVATDDCTTGHAQIVKLAYSADGTRTHVPADADGLLVNLGTNNDVTVTAVTPGTGATSLGKAIDAVVGATDTGIAALAKHQGDSVAITTAAGDYDLLHIDSRGALVSNIEQHHVFDSFNATTGWSVLNDDTTNLATTSKHLVGTSALTFDKANGTANTIFAGIQKTLSSVNLGDVSMHDLLQGAFYIPSLTNVAYVFLRLGTDSSNYNEWRLPDTALTEATFLVGSSAVGDANYAGITGNGWNPAAITYIAVGAAFDNQTDTLAGLVFDEVSYHTNTHTAASLGVEVSSDVSTPNVNVQKIGNTNTATNTGSVSAGTLRVTLATDVALPAGTNAIGKLAANTGVDIGDVDVTSIVPGTAATNLGKAIDSIAGATDTGVAMLAIRDDALATLTPADGDYAPLRVDSQGGLVLGGDVHDATDTGNPIKLGAKAETSPAGSTLVADGDRTNLYADVDGLLMTKPFTAYGDILVERLTDTGGTSTASTVFGATANARNFITTIAVYNSSASAGYVDFRDGTAGTVLFTMPLPAGGGSICNFPLPLRQTTTNTALAYDVSAALTTVYISLVGFKSKA